MKKVFNTKIFYFSILPISIIILLYCNGCAVSIEKQKLTNILNRYKNIEPNQLYSLFGKPDDYIVVVNKQNKIINGKAVYKYIFDFNRRDYECEISFITNQKQTKIIDFEFNSNKCYYLAMY